MFKKVYLVQDNTTIGTGYDDNDIYFEEKSVIDKNNSSEDFDVILVSLDHIDFDTNVSEDIEVTTKVKND